MRCRWNQGSFFGQLPWRHWRRLPKLGRPGSSCPVSTGVCPLLAGLGAPRLSPSGALSHLITLVAYGGLCGLLNSLRMAFRPPNANLPGSLVPHNPIGAYPEPQEAGRVGARPIGPIVGLFSQQQLSYWAACTSDPWVVSTLTQGYEL